MPINDIPDHAPSQWTGPERGFFYARAREWITINTEIDHTAYRVYITAVSAVEAANRRGIQLTKDKIRWCTAGTRGKPMSTVTFNRMLNALESYGLLEVTTSSTAEHDRNGQWCSVETLRVQVNDLPPMPEPYSGYRNVLELLEAYPGQGWGEHEYSRRRSAHRESNSIDGASCENADSSSAHRESNSIDGASCENADSSSAHRESNSIETDSVSSGDSAVDDEMYKMGRPPATPAPAHEAAGEAADGTELAGGGESDDQNDHDAAATALLRADALLQALTMPHGPAYRASKRALRSVARALAAEVSEDAITRALLADISDAHTPAKVVDARLPDVETLIAGPDPQRANESQESATGGVPPICGQCDARYESEPASTRMVEGADGLPRRCPRCHPLALDRAAGGKSVSSVAEGAAAAIGLQA